MLRKLLLLACVVLVAIVITVLLRPVHREYLYLVSSPFRPDLEVKGDPPLPTISVGEHNPSVARGSVSWHPAGGLGFEGDMFMTAPELARFYKLKPVRASKGSTIDVAFPLPVTKVKATTWRFGRIIGEEEITGGRLTAPVRPGLYTVGIQAFFHEGNAHYAFLIRVR